MPSQALETQGFKLEIKTATTPSIVWTEVGEVTSFQGFDGQAAEIDVTHLQSDAKEFRMGLQDWGNFSVETNYLPEDEGQQAMRDAKSDRTLQDFRATFSDGSTAAFSGYVTSAPMSGGVDAKLDGSFAIRVSGDVVFA